MPLVAPYNAITATKVSPSDAAPRRDDIRFVAGNQVDLRYMWQNVVWTEERPTDADAADLPMFAQAELDDGTAATELGEAPVVHPGAGANYSDTLLVAPWRQRFWFSEIRNEYLNTTRQYNGWVPWYGRRPSWGWWNMAGLRGVFTVTATYDPDLEATVTHSILPSQTSKGIQPSDSYHWDLSVAVVATWTEDDPPEPETYTAVRTMIGGRAEVLQNWTRQIPVS